MYTVEAVYDPKAIPSYYLNLCFSGELQPVSSTWLKDCICWNDMPWAVVPFLSSKTKRGGWRVQWESLRNTSISRVLWWVCWLDECQSHNLPTSPEAVQQRSKTCCPEGDPRFCGHLSWCSHHNTLLIYCGVASITLNNVWWSRLALNRCSKTTVEHKRPWEKWKNTIWNGHLDHLPFSPDMLGSF